MSRGVFDSDDDTPTRVDEAHTEPEEFDPWAHWAQKTEKNELVFSQDSIEPDRIMEVDNRPKLNIVQVEQLKANARARVLGDPLFVEPAQLELPLPAQHWHEQREPEVAFGTVYAKGMHNYACTGCEKCDEFEGNDTRRCANCGCALIHHLIDADDADVATALGEESDEE